MTLTRPRKARILEKAGLRYVAAWLPANTVEKLEPEIKQAEDAAKAAIEAATRGEDQ